MVTQPLLVGVPVASDVVYTPDWVVRDMVAHFKPERYGRILEPSAGEGAFLRRLPPWAEWCEIEKGRDFWKWREPVDLIFGNPPYSNFGQWLRHSMSLAGNVVYLIPQLKPFANDALFRDIYKWGGIVKIRHYGRLREVFPGLIDTGWPVSAFHFQRGYTGGITVSFAEV